MHCNSTVTCSIVIAAGYFPQCVINVRLTFWIHQILTGLQGTEYFLLRLSAGLILYTTESSAIADSLANGIFRLFLRTFVRSKVDCSVLIVQRQSNLLLVSSRTVCARWIVLSSQSDFKCAPCVQTGDSTPYSLDWSHRVRFLATLCRVPGDRRRTLRHQSQPHGVRIDVSLVSVRAVDRDHDRSSECLSFEHVESGAIT